MDLNIAPRLPQNKEWRIGIAGSGFIVNDCHLAAYRKAGFNPVAIASRNPEKACTVAENHDIGTVYRTYDELINDAAIEVFDVAVPPNALLGIIRKICAAGTAKGILAQKPLGMNLKEAKEAVALCERSGIVLAVNQNMRYDQSVRAAKSLLSRGVLGEPVLASIDMRGIPHWMPWQKDLGWATLRIMSIHHMDAMRYWFGDPINIYCSVRPDPRTTFPHQDGICVYIMEFASGLRAVCIDDVWTGPAKEGCPKEIGINWRIEGTDGLALGEIGWCLDPYTTPSSMRWARKGDAEFHRPAWSESWFPDAFIGTMAQLLVALEEGREPEISGRDNLKTMALVDAAYLSAQLKRAVTLKESLECS
ncbi:MAG: Gfo/Idh/MocA family protein [Verrucomicrobiales bacterium]